jgi:hypothetical protein
MAANPDATSALQAPATGPTDKDRAALAFIVRAEAGRLPEFPRGIYPYIRFSWDGRDGHNRLLIQPRAADCDLRRLYRDFIHEHNAELKTVCRLRQEAIASAESRDSDVVSRVAPVSRSDLRKTQIVASERVTPETYGAKPSDPEPVVVVQGYRITEHDVRAMLASYGDEELRRYDTGELPRNTAYRQARTFYTHSLRMGLQVAIRGSAGRVFLFPPLRIPRAPSTTDPSTDF